MIPKSLFFPKVNKYIIAKGKGHQKKLLKRYTEGQRTKRNRN